MARSGVTKFFQNTYQPDILVHLLIRASVYFFKGKLMFKKTLAAVAVGMVAFGAQAAEFKIGDDVVFQANFDLLAEVWNKQETVGTSQNLLGNGQIQLRSTKTLTPDLSVFGQIEVDFDPAVNNAPAWADDSRIGLASKSFGTFSVGQFDSFIEDNIGEAITLSPHAETAVFVDEPTKDFNDGRAVQYVTPKINGFFGVIGLNYSTQTSNTEQSIGTSFVLGYDLNGLKVFVGQSNLPKFTDAAGTLHTMKTGTGGAASYKFGDTTVAASAWKTTKLSTTTQPELDINYTGIGVAHVMGPLDFSLTFQNVVNNTSATVATTANQWAAGVGYTVTKGTVIYLHTNSLGATNKVGDFMVAGIKTSF
jgi:hypothetical protein